MASALTAGLAYFAGVFALAFMFGMLRLMILVPLVGELLAVLIELPVILGFAWLLCRRLEIRFKLPAHLGNRLLMGGVALVLLMLAELGLAVAMFGSTPAAFIVQFTTLSGAVGLAGQLLFALIPALLLLKHP